MSDEPAAAVGSLGDQVARAVQRLREARRLPYTELAERLTKLGRPIPVLGIRRIERGERRVDVDELAALAEALGVPPLLLLFPIESSDGSLPGTAPVELLPGVTVEAWAAAQWFTGEAPLVSDTNDSWRGMADPGGWSFATMVLRQLREQERFLAEWTHAKGIRDDAETERIERKWREARTTARRFGQTPAPLPAVLAHVDQPPS